jgi:hypothetical protein
VTKREGEGRAAGDGVRGTGGQGGLGGLYLQVTYKGFSFVLNEG